MMTRIASCAAALALFLAISSPARAQGIGREFFEKMSGPKFEGWEVRIPAGCLWDNGAFTGYWQTEANRERTNGVRRFCFDVAYASMNNTDRDETGALLNLQRWEGLAVYRLDSLAAKENLFWLNGFEPGLAIGAIGFLADTGRAWRFTLAPRLAIKPLNFIPGMQESRWSNVLQLSIRGQWMGDVTNTDLALGPAYEPFEDGFVWGGTWIAIDLSQALGLR